MYIVQTNINFDANVLITKRLKCPNTNYPKKRYFVTTQLALL